MVAVWARDYEPGGRRFESCRALHFSEQIDHLPSRTRKAADMLGDLTEDAAKVPSATERSVVSYLSRISRTSVKAANVNGCKGFSLQYLST
jgi:hypothetical protein